MADANIRAVITAQDQASNVIKGFGSNLQALGEIAGGVFAVDKVISFGQEVITAFNKSQLATTELNAVLASTGDISGVTAKQADNLASSLSQVTTFSKTTTLAAEDILLRFTNIGKSIFPQTLKATQDLATGLGTDLSSAADIVGRAMDAPANAARSLRAANIILNTQQQETIKNFVATGDGAKAQAYILDLLATKYGGLATAVGQTFGGQMQILQNNLEQVKEGMGQVLAAGIGPLVDGITGFVQKNGELISSIGLATLAGVGFAGAVVAVAGAIALADAALIPYIAAFAILAALVGGAVFGAIQSFQKQMGDSAQAVTSGSKQMASDGANNFGATGKAAADLAQKLADIQTQMDQTTADFQQSLLTMVQSNEQKLSDLKTQLADENSSFADAQKQKENAYENSRLNLQKQDMLKIGMTKDVAAQAEAIQANQIALLDAQYQEDTANAKAAHDKKTAALQAQVDQEMAFLQKHADDIKSVENVQALDEIDKLKQSHDRQMAAFAKQTEAAIDSSNSQIAAAAATNTGVTAQTADMQKNLRESYNHMQNDFKLDFIAPIQDAWQKFAAVFTPTTGAPSPAQAVGAFFGNLLSKMPHNAQGTDYWGGGPTWVGENGPEIVNLPQGSSITPNSQATGGSVHVTINTQAFMGSPLEARKFAELIVGHINDVAGKKSMTGSQLLGGA